MGSEARRVRRTRRLGSLTRDSATAHCLRVVTNTATGTDGRRSVKGIRVGVAVKSASKCAPVSQHFIAPFCKLGKEASALARKLLEGVREIRLHVRAAGKEKTRKAPGQKQRYSGIVELIDRAGKSVMLHERLLEEGQARAFGSSAPWPPKEAARLREQKAEKGFEPHDPQGPRTD